VYPIIREDVQRYINLGFEEYLSNKADFDYIPKLIHSDLSLNHLLYNEENQEFNEIIDFGDIQICDPDFEYVYLLGDCGIDLTKKVMKLRQEVDIKAKLKKVSFFLTVDNVGIILDGIKTNNQITIDRGIKLLEDEISKMM
jgi:aminoglycoside 2''-phosphotransferase